MGRDTEESWRSSRRVYMGGVRGLVGPPSNGMVLHPGCPKLSFSLVFPRGGGVGRLSSQPVSEQASLREFEDQEPKKKLTKKSPFATPVHRIEVQNHNLRPLCIGF